MSSPSALSADSDVVAVASSPTTEKSPPFQVWCWTLLTSLLAFLSLRHFNSFQIGAYLDDAKYVVLAKSLVAGREYGLSIGPAPPAQTGYPFGFPLLLAPFAYFFPDWPDAMKVISFAATLANVALLFWGWSLLSPGTSRWWAVLVVAAYVVAPGVIGHSRMVMSEAVFLTYVLTALLLTEDLIRRGDAALSRSALLGVVLVLAGYTRTVGVALWAAVMIRMLTASQPFRRQRLAALGGAACLVLVIVVVATPVRAAHLLPARYLASFRQPSLRGISQVEDSLASRMARGGTAYVGTHLRLALVPVGGGVREKSFGQQWGIEDLPRLLSLIGTAVVLVGAVTLGLRGALTRAVLLFQAFYVLILLLWYIREPRLLYPIQPFLLFELLAGAGVVVCWLVRRVRATSGPRHAWEMRAAAAVGIALFGGGLYKAAAETPGTARFVRDFKEGSTWIDAHAPTDAVVMAQESCAVSLYAKRATVDFPQIQKPGDLERAADAYGVSYILVAPKREWRFDAALEYDEYTSTTILPSLNALLKTGRVSPVYESLADRVRVYRVISKAAGDWRAPAPR